MIFLDANATTAPLPSVVEAMIGVLRGGPANPASVHEAGRLARQAVERARDAAAHLLDVDCDGIVFTSGTTEGNNTVIGGVCRLHPDTVIVTSNAEHPSLTAPAGAARVHEEVPVTREGNLDPDRVAQALPPGGPPPLVALAWVNGETGIVQPVHAIAAAVRARRPDAVLLVDAAQAIGRLPAGDIPGDVVTFSGHKLHGPAGIGVMALADPDEDRIAPLILGGGQERGRRSGTTNVAGAVGLGVALGERHAHLAEAISRMEAMRDAFEAAVLERVDGAVVNGRAGPRVPNTANIRFDRVNAVALVARLDQKGLAASFGSACQGGRPGPSPTLRAMGLSEREAEASVRFSFSVLNTMDEAQEAADIVARTVEEMR